MDCLIIGFHELDLHQVVHEFEIMKKYTGAYRNLLHSTVRFRGEMMHYTDIFNKIISEATGEPSHLHPMRMPNLAVCYLKSFLEQRHLDVEMINFSNAEKNNLEELLRKEPTAAAITTTYYISDSPVIALVKMIRKLSPRTKIIVGGPYIASIFLTSRDVTTQDYIFGKIGADIYVNSSQGELTLARILASLCKDKNRDLQNIPNLVFQKEVNGRSPRDQGLQEECCRQFARTRLEPEDNDLNGACVDWRFFPTSFLTPTAFMRTSRGCAFQCAFCNYPFISGRGTYSNLDTVEKEMRQLSDAGVRYLVFIDDTFNVPLPRFKQILRMMIANDFKFTWFSFFRCSHTDEETFELMQQSGCCGVFLGIESGDQKILNNMNKKVKVEQYINGIRKLHERGIFTFASFIVGFPGETEESVQNTITFLEEAQPTFLKAELYFHSHHVPIHQQAEKFGLTGNGFGWQHETMDWQEACSQIERIYKNVTPSLVCPLYMFDFWTIPYLLGQGVTLEQIKQFLKLCRPLLLRNFETEASGNEDEIFLPLFELGREINELIGL